LRVRPSIWIINGNILLLRLRLGLSYNHRRIVSRDELRLTLKRQNVLLLLLWNLGVDLWDCVVESVYGLRVNAIWVHFKLVRIASLNNKINK
jgi:hypothetical protein